MRDDWVWLYHRSRRKPEDGSVSAAIRVHAQACGLVAFVYDVHPDRVAEAVRDAQRAADEGVFV